MGPVLGRETTVRVAGLPAVAWVPALLGDRPLALTEGTVRDCATAAGSILRAGDRIGVRHEALARLLLRREGIASSNIEALDAPPEQVALAAVDDRLAGDTAAWMAGNLLALDDALEHAAGTAPLTTDHLHRWHALLMRHGTLPDEMVGTPRRQQGWIGGYSPQTAAYVPPPADALDELLADLVDWLAVERLDPVADAAIAHAQFETIHPYADGNGRIGRLLVTWLLHRRLAAWPPAASVQIARDIGGYLSGLTLFRTTGDDEWVRWFAQAVDAAAHATLRWVGDVEALLEEWRARLENLRADAIAHAIVEDLSTQPVVSIRLVEERHQVSSTTARSAVDVLEQRGILRPVDAAPTGRAGRPERWWVASDLLRLSPTT